LKKKTKLFVEEQPKEKKIQERQVSKRKRKFVWRDCKVRCPRVCKSVELFGRQAPCGSFVKYILLGWVLGSLIGAHVAWGTHPSDIFSWCEEEGAPTWAPTIMPTGTNKTMITFSKFVCD